MAPSVEQSTEPEILLKKGATMKLNTIQRKKARGGFEQAVGREEIVNRMYEIIQVGKQGSMGS